MMKICPDHGPYDANPFDHHTQVCPHCSSGAGRKPPRNMVYRGELHEEMLQEVFARLDPQERLDMEMKTMEVRQTKKFSSYESQLLFESAFRLGYLASKVEKQK